MADAGGCYRLDSALGPGVVPGFGHRQVRNSHDVGDGTMGCPLEKVKFEDSDAEVDAGAQEHTGAGQRGPAWSGVSH